MGLFNKLPLLGLVCLMAGMLFYGFITQAPEGQLTFSHYDHNKHRILFTKCMGSSEAGKASKVIEGCHNQAGRIILKEIIGGKNE